MPLKTPRAPKALERLLGAFRGAWEFEGAFQGSLELPGASGLWQLQPRGYSRDNADCQTVHLHGDRNAWRGTRSIGGDGNRVGKNKGDIPVYLIRQKNGMAPTPVGVGEVIGGSSGK